MGYQVPNSGQPATKWMAFPPKQLTPCTWCGEPNTTTSSCWKTFSYSNDSCAHTSPRLQPPNGTPKTAWAKRLWCSREISPEEYKFNWTQYLLTVSKFILFISKHCSIFMWKKLLEELFIVNVKRCMLIQCLFIDFLTDKTLEITAYSVIHYVYCNMFRPVTATIIR
jgi:hypothetical protein